MPTYTYVSVSEEDRIAVYLTDPESGKLSPHSEVAVEGTPAPMAVDPTRRFVYVGRRGANKISSYRIDPDNGGLSLIGTVSLESDPCFLATDKTGRFLLSAYYAGGLAAVHPIGDDGAATGPAIEWLATSPGAHSIQTDPTNRFAFLPHIAGTVGPNRILQFRFDESTGKLTPNSPFELVPEEGVGPRHYRFNPTKDIVYFCNEQGCSVTAYHLDTSKGTLSPFQTVPTLPEGYDGENTCAQIQITDSGRFLYAPNRGHDSIAGFAIDATTGRLTPIGHVAAEPHPRATSLSLDGRYLYVAGLDSGRMVSYRIDDDTGELQPRETYEVGAGPMWILITEPAG
jgi:6-phosphogluconolactonase